MSDPVVNASASTDRPSVSAPGSVCSRTFARLCPKRGSKYARVSGRSGSPPVGFASSLDRSATASPLERPLSGARCTFGRTGRSNNTRPVMRSLSSSPQTHDQQERKGSDADPTGYRHDQAINELLPPWIRTIAGLPAEQYGEQQQRN